MRTFTHAQVEQNVADAMGLLFTDIHNMYRFDSEQRLVDNANIVDAKGTPVTLKQSKPCGFRKNGDMTDYTLRLGTIEQAAQFAEYYNKLSPNCIVACEPLNDGQCYKISFNTVQFVDQIVPTLAKPKPALAKDDAKDMKGHGAQFFKPAVKPHDVSHLNTEALMASFKSSLELKDQDVRGAGVAVENLLARVCGLMQDQKGSAFSMLNNGIIHFNLAVQKNEHHQLIEYRFPKAMVAYSTPNRYSVMFDKDYFVSTVYPELVKLRNKDILADVEYSLMPRK